jgi:hypothetical protein
MVSAVAKVQTGQQDGTAIMAPVIQTENDRGGTMKRILQATPAVLPGKAITRRKGANRAHRSWRVLWGAALVALLALLPGAGQTGAATPPSH